jgi:hypothetical protein
MRIYRYRIVLLSAILRKQVDTLNELGRDGWELITVMTSDDGKVAYLQKPL